MTPTFTTKPSLAKKPKCNAPIPGLNPEVMKKKILMVNDDPHISELLLKGLRAEGHGVVIATTGQEGIRRFYADQYDLLILDVNLPDTSGWNIFKTLTSINPFLPIVITWKNDQHELEAFEGGALLSKLLGVPKILQTIVGNARRFVGGAFPMSKSKVE